MPKAPCLTGSASNKHLAYVSLHHCSLPAKVLVSKLAYLGGESETIGLVETLSIVIRLENSTYSYVFDGFKSDLKRGMGVGVIENHHDLQGRSAFMVLRDCKDAYEVTMVLRRVHATGSLAYPR